MMALWLLCGILAVSVLALSLRLWLLHRDLRQLGEDLRAHLATDTNTLLCVHGNDRQLRRLAATLNTQLRELRRQRRRYLAGDRELKEAIIGISHDLRTPLTAIFGYLEMLEQEPLPPAAARRLAVVRERAALMERLVEELFGYALVLQAQPERPEQPVNINALLEESLTAFYVDLHGRGIAPQIQMPPQPVLRCLDAAMLRRVFANLLSNAVKYSAGDLSVTLSAAGHIVFANSAPGLNEVQVGRLFDRFYTVNTGRQSTGLGLAVARTLTQHLGGELTACYTAGCLQLHLQLPPAKIENFT